MTGLLQVVPYELDVARQRLQVVEDQLFKTHYLLGDEFTAVDIMCGQILTLAEASHCMTLSAFMQLQRNVLPWVQTISYCGLCWSFDYSQLVLASGCTLVSLAVCYCAHLCAQLGRNMLHHHFNDN